MPQLPHKMTSDWFGGNKLQDRAEWMKMLWVGGFQILWRPPDPDNELDRRDLRGQLMDTIYIHVGAVEHEWPFWRDRNQVEQVLSQMSRNSTPAGREKYNDLPPAERLAAAENDRLAQFMADYDAFGEAFFEIIPQGLLNRWIAAGRPHPIPVDQRYLAWDREGEDENEGEEVP